MKKSLEEKFEVIDLIFSNYGLFLTELEFKTPKMKRFAVMVLKDNSEAIEEIGEKVNILIRDKEYGEIDHNKLTYYSEQMESLSKELEKNSEILCTLNQDNIKVEILLKEEKVIFNFKEDDYMDPLIDYLKNNLGKKLLTK